MICKITKTDDGMAYDFLDDKGKSAASGTCTGFAKDWTVDGVPYVSVATVGGPISLHCDRLIVDDKRPEGDKEKNLQLDRAEEGRNIVSKREAYINKDEAGDAKVTFLGGEVIGKKVKYSQGGGLITLITVDGEDKCVSVLTFGKVMVAEDAKDLIEELNLPTNVVPTKEELAEPDPEPTKEDLAEPEPPKPAPKKRSRKK